MPKRNWLKDIKESETIRQEIDPKIHPRITVEKIAGKSLIIVEVKESPDHLVLAFGS